MSIWNSIKRRFRETPNQIDITHDRLSPSGDYAPEALEAARLVSEGGRAHSTHDYAVALEKNTAALRKYRHLDDPNGILMCLSNIGNIHQALGDIASATTAYEEALNMNAAAIDDDRLPTLATCLVNLGALRGAAGDLDGPMHLFSQALEIHVKQGDEMGQARCLTNLGMVHQRRSEWDLATDAYHRALALTVTGENPEVQLTCNYQLGMVHEAQSNFPHARAAYEAALRIARRHQDTRTVMCLMRLGKVSEQINDTAGAVVYLTDALEIAREGDDNGAVVPILLQIAALQESAENFSAALDAYQRALERAPSAGVSDPSHIVLAMTRCLQRADPSGYAQFLFEGGLAVQQTGDARAAIELYERSLRIRKEVGEAASAGFCELAIATCHKELDDRSSQLASLNRALAAFRTSQTIGGAPEGLALCLYEIGLFHNLEGNLVAALPFYVEAAEVNRKLNNQERLSTCLLAAGTCCRYSGELHKSLTFFIDALEATRTLNNPEALAMCFFAIGDNYRVLQDYPNALDFLQKALKVDREADALDRVASRLNMIAALHAEGGDITKAIASYQEALALARQLNNATQMAEILNGLGQLCQTEGPDGRKRALEYFKEALGLSERMDQSSIGAGVNIASCTISIADILESEGDIDSALTYYKKGIESLDQLTLPLRILQGYRLRCELGIGTIHERQGRIDDALQCYTHAIQLACSFGNIGMLAMIKGCRGIALLNRGNTIAARDDLVEAITQVEQLRLDVKASRDQQIHILGHFSEIYSSLIEGILWPECELGIAMGYLERSKGRTLTRLLEWFDRQPGPTVPVDIANEFLQVSKRERELEMWPEDTRPEGSYGAERIAVAVQREKLVQQIMRYDPEFDPTSASQIGTLAELQGALVQDIGVVELFHGKNKNLAFVLSKARGLVGVEIVDYPPERLRQTANEWIKAYGLLHDHRGPELWRDVIDKTMAELYVDFWLPIREHLPATVRSIVFIPHRLFHLFPLHAMYAVCSSQRKYLLDQYREVSYAPTAAVFARCEGRRRPAAAKFVAIDNPTGDLRFASEEVDAIAKLFEAPLLIGPRRELPAIASRCIDATRTANVVLWTGHSVGGGSDRAQVHLSNGEHLTLKELFKGLELSKCSLWDFDTCETAFHLPDASGEWVNLASAPLCTGARTVWSTLWAVDDFATATLKKRAFQNLIQNGMGPAEALNAAQRWMLRGPVPSQQGAHDGGQEQPPSAEKYRHPMYWAAFISSGARSRSDDVAGATH